MRIVLVIILITGTLRAPGFAFFQKAPDSLDQYINSQIEQVYEGAYYRDPDSVSKKFDELKKQAEKEGRYHMSLYLLAVEAQCMAFHNRFERMRTLIANAKEFMGNHERNIARVDTLHDARNTVDFTEGLYFYSVGDYHRSIRCFNTLLEKDEARQTLGADYLFSIHSYLGACYQRLLLYDKAYLHYSKAMEAAKLSNYSDYNTALIHTYLGDAKAGMVSYGDGDKDDLKQAEDHYTQALQFFLKYKDDASYSNAIAATYSQLALLNVSRGNFETAIKQLKMTSEYSATSDPDMVITYMDYGDLYKKMGETELAKTYYQHSRALSKQLYKEKHVRKSYPLFALAELSIQSNLYDSALYLCEEGLSQVTYQSAGDTIINHLQVLEGLKIKGKAFAGKYSKSKNKGKHLDAAIGSYLSALEVIDEINKKLPYTEYKKHFKAHLQDFYESALETVYLAASEGHGQKNYVELLYDLMESNKNTMLTEALNNTMALQYAGIPSRLIEKEINLKSRAAELRRNLSQEYDHVDSARWRNDLYEVTNSLDSLVKGFETEYPRYYYLKYNNNRYSLSEIKKHLKPNEILLEYFWGENEVYCMGVSSNKTVIKKIELNSEIYEILTSLITFSRGNPHSKEKDFLTYLNDFAGSSNKIHDIFLKPVLSGFDQKRYTSLVIVPDGMLAYLPFEILLTSQAGQSKDYSSLPYLLRDYNIRSLFASSFLAESTFENVDLYEYAYLGFAPAYSNSAQGERTTGTASPGFLKYNQQEVLNASDYFDNKVFIREDATKENFLNSVGTGKILHLATHAFTSDEDPSYSSLIFSSYDTDEPGDIGHLHLDEIYNLTLNADLVVLSGCETGTGKYLRGEGIISLGRAFRYAGCPNIVMSHWQVNDKSTAFIMDEFFHNLKKGMNKSEALRKAKLTFLDDPKNKYFSHPYYWSAFVLMGDAKPVSSRSWSAEIVIALCLLVGLMTLVFAKKRRKKTS